MVLPARSGNPEAEVPPPVPPVALGAQAVKTRLARTSILKTNVIFFITSLSFRNYDLAVSDNGVQESGPGSFDITSIDQLSKYGKRKKPILSRLFDGMKKNGNDIMLKEHVRGDMR
jgi:hypothetical protein